jgi:hypothetical protein
LEVYFMKRFLVFAIAVTMVWFATPAMADHATTSVGDFAGGLAASRHNISSSGSHFTTGSTAAIADLTGAAGVGTTTEMCVFCHTPHHTATDAAPLWNRTGAVTSFTTYGNGAGDLDWDAKTYVGKTTVGDPKWGSLACLTCHDGVTTLDALINRPGKGTAPVADWNFWEGTDDVSDFLTSGRLNIGSDLTNDHPISLRFRAGSVASLRTSSTVLSSVNMCNQQESDGSCAEELVNGNLWAIAGFINDTATIDDLMRGSTGGATLECSSCHDPHYKNLTNPEAYYVSTRNGSNDHTDLENDGLFLRRVGGNSDSGVCRTCHAKADAI